MSTSVLRRSVQRMVAVVALAFVFLAGTTALKAQLANASCCPTWAYGCMAVVQMTINGTSSNSTTTCPACVTSGTTSGFTFNAVPGQTASWSCVAGLYSGSTYYQGYLLIFVDWNNNGVMTDAGECMYTPSAYEYFRTFQPGTGSFVIPSNVTPGPKRMRVMFNYYYYPYYYWYSTAYIPPQNPCFPGSQDGYGNYGGFQDYTLNVGYTNDAAMNGISTSTAPPFASGLNDITLSFKNNGVNAITSATFN